MKGLFIWVSFVRKCFYVYAWLSLNFEQSSFQHFKCSDYKACTTIPYMSYFPNVSRNKFQGWRDSWGKRY